MALPSDVATESVLFLLLLRDLVKTFHDEFHKIPLSIFQPRNHYDLRNHSEKKMYLILQCYCNKYAGNTTCNHILLECIPVYFSIFVTYVMCCVGDRSTDFNHI